MTEYLSRRVGWWRKSASTPEFPQQIHFPQGWHCAPARYRLNVWSSMNNIWVSNRVLFRTQIKRTNWFRWCWKENSQTLLLNRMKQNKTKTTKGKNKALFGTDRIVSFHFEWRQSDSKHHLQKHHRGSYHHLPWSVVRELTQAAGCLNRNISVIS